MPRPIEGTPASARAAVGRLHDPRPAAGDDREALLPQPPRQIAGRRVHAGRDSGVRAEPKTDTALPTLGERREPAPQLLVHALDPRVVVEQARRSRASRPRAAPRRGWWARAPCARGCLLEQVGAQRRRARRRTPAACRPRPAGPATIRVEAWRWGSQRHAGGGHHRERAAVLDACGRRRTRAGRRPPGSASSESTTTSASPPRSATRFARSTASSAACAWASAERSNEPPVTGAPESRVHSVSSSGRAPTSTTRHGHVGVLVGDRGHELAQQPGGAGAGPAADRHARALAEGHRVERGRARRAARWGARA